MKFTHTTLLILSLFLPQGCDSGGGVTPPSIGGHSDDSGSGSYSGCGQNNQTNGTQGGFDQNNNGQNNDGQTNTGQTNSDQNNNGNNFPLLLEVTYEKDLKSIMSSKCVSCHSSKTAKLDSYDSVKNYKYEIVDVVDGTAKANEHSSLSLGQSQEETFQDWKEAGYPRGTEGSTDPNANSNPVGGLPAGQVSNNVPDNCGNSTLPTQAAAADELGDLVNSDIKKECDGKGLMVNRDAKECYTSKLDNSWCNDQGIVAKFQAASNSGQAVQGALTTYKGKGYVIDQCGADGAAPMVTLYFKNVPEEKLDIAAIKPQ